MVELSSLLHLRRQRPVPCEHSGGLPSASHQMPQVLSLPAGNVAAERGLYAICHGVGLSLTQREVVVARDVFSG